MRASVRSANSLAVALVAADSIDDAILVLERSAEAPRERHKSNAAHHYLAMLDRLARLYLEAGRLDGGDRRFQ